MQSINISESVHQQRKASLTKAIAPSLVLAVLFLFLALTQLAHSQGHEQDQVTGNGPDCTDLSDIPLMGFGTWVDSYQRHPSSIGECVASALEAGVRHLDCAINYNNHKSVGLGLKKYLEGDSKRSRGQLWITSKFPVLPVNKDVLLSSVDQILKDLQTSYLDLLLIHSPNGAEFNDENLTQAWKNMSQLLQTGKVRFIGVSNFYEGHMRMLLPICQREGLPRPYVNQIEINPLNSEVQYVKFCQNEGIRVTAYAPLGGLALTNVMQIENVNLLAKKHDLTPAQVILAWLMKRKISVIPKSFSKDHIIENLQAENYKDLLTEEDVESISNATDFHFPTVDTAQDARFMSESIMQELQKDK